VHGCDLECHPAAPHSYLLASAWLIGEMALFALREESLPTLEHPDLGALMVVPAGGYAAPARPT